MRAWLLTAAFTSAAASGAAAASLDFDKTFDDRNEPRQAHYVATYRLGASEHRVEVWRDADRRLRRRTDDAIETLVVKPAGEAEWSMTVLDLRRRIRTDVARTNLFRIGHFTDWFALAHALSRPVGAYELTALKGAAPPVQAIAACRWYSLVQASRTSRICWSAAQHLPLVITDGQGRVQWKVTESGTGPLPAQAFAVDDRGFVRNDANADIQAD